MIKGVILEGGTHDTKFAPGSAEKNPNICTRRFEKLTPHLSYDYEGVILSRPIST